MDRRRWMLRGLNIKELQGIEIGPLTSPIVTRNEGSILYVDHVDTASLRAKYKEHPQIEPTQIMEVDAVWSGNTLQQAIGEGLKMDYVLASHVVEHAPDLLGWIAQIYEVLRPGGELRLIVPDRRFTFDRLRQETRFSDIVYAHLLGAKVPLPPMILDHMLEVAHVDFLAVWRGTVDDNTLVRMHDFTLAKVIATDVMRNSNYHDVHCWTFTPGSFVKLMARAAEAGLLQFECVGLRETEDNDFEFFVQLQRPESQANVASSWRQLSDTISRGTSAQLAPAPANIGSPNTSFAASLAKIAVELDNAIFRLGMIDASATKDVMGPVRAAAEALRQFAAPNL